MWAKDSNGQMILLELDARVFVYTVRGTIADANLMQSAYVAHADVCRSPRKRRVVEFRGVMKVEKDDD